MIDKMTVKDAAVYLGTTRQKIHRLIRDGILVTESNPLDERNKLIAVADLDRLKEYPKATRAKPKPKEPPPEPVKQKFTGAVKNRAWDVSRELGFNTISRVKNFMLNNPELMDMPYEELKKAVAAKFKKEVKE